MPGFSEVIQAVFFSEITLAVHVWDEQKIVNCGHPWATSISSMGS